MRQKAKFESIGAPQFGHEALFDKAVGEEFARLFETRNREVPRITTTIIPTVMYGKRVVGPGGGGVQQTLEVELELNRTSIESVLKCVVKVT